jgi:putative endonuclease
MWYVYLILTKKNKLYTGISTDPQRRFQEHLSGKKGAKYFRQDPPIRIVYQEESPNRSDATKRELQIKKMTRKQKEELIQQD